MVRALVPPESVPGVWCQTLVATGGYTITCLPSLGSIAAPFFVSPLSVGFSFSPKHRKITKSYDRSGFWKIINCIELSSAAQDMVAWCPCSQPHHGKWSVFRSHRSIVTWHSTFYKQRHALDSYPWIGKIKSRPSVKYSSYNTNSETSLLSWFWRGKWYLWSRVSVCCSRLWSQWPGRGGWAAGPGWPRSHWPWTGSL